MRIRKRFLSLSAALSSPPPLDLHRRQIRLHGHDCTHHTNKTKIFDKLEESGIKKQSINEDDDDEDDSGCGKESILCGEAINNHDLVLKGWLEGDGPVVAKKKRGSNGRRLSINDVVQDSETSKKNDKCVGMSSKKKEKREGVIMEGSRCSRVNGRGWRCIQQTLVGYSLCEHHLGKGRLRSIASVRGRVHSVAPKERNNDDEDEKDEEVKGWDVESMSSSMEGTKVFSKKTKVGMVKARSLSSLLSQISS